jgi:hypothetical protein
MVQNSEFYFLKAVDVVLALVVFVRNKLAVHATLQRTSVGSNKFVALSE